VTYADAQSDQVSRITDPEGHATVFSYSSNRCTAITDPFGRATALAYTASDLASITKPDGEVESFTYQAHQMATKVTRGGLDTTTYAYNPDGTVQSAVKPAGETTSVLASLSNPGAYVGGAFTRSGSYTDAHGVAHSFVTNVKSDIESDVYTASGVGYTRALVYAPSLDVSGTDFANRNGCSSIAAA
jgi:YD repeat-containing protein